MAAIPPPVLPHAPPPPGGPATFADLYADPNQDPYAGANADVMNVFTIAPGGVGWNSATKFATAVGVGTNVANAFVGLFEYPGEPAGRTRLIHAPIPFPLVMGRPTVYDVRVYGFLDDVASGTVQSVLFPDDAFDEASGGGAMNIFRDIATATTAWAADPTLTVVDRLPNGADVIGVRVPRFMYVPAAYIPLFLGRRLTPRQLVDEVLATIATNGHEADLTALVRWCLAAGTAAGLGDTESPLHAGTDVTVPVADAVFFQWRQTLLHAMLPGLTGAGAGPATAATVRIASLMSDILREQRETRRDAADARASAVTPKTVSEYFKPYLTGKLMSLCGATNETDLPDLWADLASANGKQDREVIEENFRTIASGLSLAELTPVVTPGFAKKVTAMRFAGSNLDDLTEGVHPFSIIIMDHTTASGEQAYNDAMAAAFDYDDIMRGTGADLNDIKTLKGSSKVVLPETFALARAMLQAYRIVLLAILGETHALVMAYTRFLNGYTNRENFYMGRLQRIDPFQGAARLLRYVQLVMRAWFEEKWNATAAGAAAVALPDFQLPLHKMALGDMYWLPALPAKYVRTGPAPSPAPGPAPVTPDKKKSEQVRNPAVNSRFEDFKTMISKSKFNDVIKKVGDPPTVVRDGKAVAMCASYHLRGSCFSNCSRRNDHGPHSQAEDDDLYNWCKKAFE